MEKCHLEVKKNMVNCWGNYSVDIILVQIKILMFLSYLGRSLEVGCHTFLLLHSRICQYGMCHTILQVQSTELVSID